MQYTSAQANKLLKKLNEEHERLEYQYVNYDIDSVKQDYAAISEELSRAQVALDCLNNTETFSFSIE
jgi:hypothetical protein